MSIAQITEKKSIMSAYNMTIAENEQKVFEAGKKAEYDAFWDGYQQNGNRAVYAYAFSGYGWNNNTFKPKYDIKPTDISQMFTSTSITDLVSALKDIGRTFDTSNATSMSYFAQYSSLTHIPTLDFRNLLKLDYFLLSNRSLISIEKIILKNDGSQTFSNYTFNNNPSLEEIRFEGVIGQNGLNLQWSTKLSHDRITNIIGVLSTTTSGLSIALSKTAVDNAFEGGSTGQEWATLIATKSNWTISLA